MSDDLTAPMHDCEATLPDPNTWPLHGFVCACGERYRLSVSVHSPHGAKWTRVQVPVPVPEPVDHHEALMEQEAAASMVEHRGLPDGVHEKHLKAMAGHLANDLRNAPLPLTLVASERAALAEYLVDKGWRR